MKREIHGGLLLLCLVLGGCVTSTLPSRSWIEIQTRHYDILSSIGEVESKRLAYDLERFRSATEFVLGRPIPPAPVRTRVYAFDGRGIGRPFALRSERGYLLPRQRGDLIVLRTGEGWSDARTSLRLAYARRLIRHAAPEDTPPWLDEGLAQLASTLEIRGRVAQLGIPHPEHLPRLRDSHWIPVDRLLATRDLEDWSSRERELFAAESWALCHYLKLDEARRERADADLSRYLALLASGTPPAEAAASALGADLQAAVWNHIRRPEITSVSLGVRLADAPGPERPVPRERVLVELGRLALAIGRPDRARGYFEQALADAPESAAALAGLGEADLDAAAESRFRAALARAPGDPRIHLDWARLLGRRAAAHPDPAERTRLAERARDHYRHSLALEASLPEAHLGLAASHLLEGEDPTRGRSPVAAARRLLPGDAAVRHLGARIALAMGNRTEARREAMLLLSRARTGPELQDARSLLERIDTRAATH